MMEQRVVPDNMFLRDVLTVREAANDCLRRSLDVKAGPRDRPVAADLLQSVLAAEIACVRRYTMMSISQNGLMNRLLRAEFQEQANDEIAHMEKVARRICELGGVPDYGAGHVASHGVALSDHDDLALRLRENLAAEQSIVAHYRDLIDYFSRRDPATSALLEDIVRDEEDHARDLEDILASCAGG